MTTEQTIAPIRVFVMKPQRFDNGPKVGRESYAFQFAFDLFEEETRLIPESSGEMPDAMGSASFTLLRRVREENGLQIPTVGAGNVVAGAYICITAGMGSTFDASHLEQVLWWGWISNVDTTQIKGADDQLGTVSALQLGHLLEGSQITGWRQTPFDLGYPKVINSPPTANMTVADGIIIGNAKLSTDEQGNPTYVFARLPADCGLASGNYWTRYRLLQHIVAFCRPSGLITTLSLSIPTDVKTFLDDTTWPETFDLRGLTLKGAFDILLPRARGIGWYLKPTADKTWTLSVYTHDCDNSYVGANTPLDIITFSSTSEEDFSFNESASDAVDEVIVRGEPLVYGVTVGFPDNNVAAGWTHGSSGDQEDLYRTAAKNETGDGGYSSWIDQKKVIRNTELRDGPALEHVFSLFGLFAYSTGSSTNGLIFRLDPPGDGTGAKSVPLIPIASWDGAHLALNENIPGAQPYWPTARFQRMLPWPKGVKADGTDTRDALSIVRPEYMEPRVFRYLSSPPSYEPDKWVNLLVPSLRVNRGAPSVDVNDRSLGLRIEYTPRETLALNHWSNTDAIGQLTPHNPTNDHRALDYKSLVFTVGLHSDQRCEVKITRPGITAPRRSLVIRDEKLKCWVMLANTILALKADGTVDRVLAGSGTFPMDANNIGYLTRNDFPTAQKICTMMAAWMFRRRVQMVHKRARPDVTPAWMAIGSMIGKVIEVVEDDTTVNKPEIAVKCYTVVELIERNYSRTSPGITVSTTIPDRPEYHIPGGVSTTLLGGKISAANKGAVLDTIKTLQSSQQSNERDSQHTPLIPAKPLSNPTSFLTVLVDKGNTLTTGQDGVKHVSPITSVPSLYDPNVTSSFIDGIGRGTLFIDGVAQTGYVLIANDSAALPNALVSGDVVATPTTKSIQVGSTTDSVTVYISAFF